MMIYTSYFGNWRNFPEGSVAISITQFPPKTWKGLELRSLAPSEQTLRQFKNKEIDETIFAYQYLTGLNKDSNLKERVRALLMHLNQEHGNVVLCCYETANDFCHRHLLADWLDLNIKELNTTC